MRTRFGIVIATFALAGLGTIVFGGVASGGTNGLPPIVIVPTEVAPGGTFTVGGEDCENPTIDTGVNAAALDPATVSVTVSFSPTPVSFPSVPTAGGLWSVDITVPDGTVAGPYTVVALCNDGGLEATGVGAAAIIAYPTEGATVTVTAAAAAQAVIAQPRTTG
jgi:hypothetical protein